MCGKENTLIKSPPRGWRPIVIYLFQGNDYNPVQAAVKRANSSRKRESGDIIYSIKSALTHATLLEFSPAELSTTSEVGKQVGGSLPENFIVVSMRRLESQNRSRSVSRHRMSISPPIHVRRANALGIIDGNISRKNRTNPQRCRQWKLLMLILDLAIIGERDTLLIRNCQSGEQNEFWMSVEIEGNVSSGTGYAGQSQGVGLNTRLLVNLL